MAQGCGAALFPDNNVLSIAVLFTFYLDNQASFVSNGVAIRCEELIPGSIGFVGDEVSVLSFVLNGECASLVRVGIDGLG